MKNVSLLAALVITASSAIAQDDILTIYKQALESNPDLSIAENNKKISDSQIKQGLGALMPQVGFTARYGTGATDTPPAPQPAAGATEPTSSGSSSSASEWDIELDQASTTLEFSVSQPLFNYQAIEAYSGFKENAKATELTLNASIMDLMVSVLDSYLNALAAQDNLKLSKSQLKAVERQLEQTEQRYEVGLVAITNVLEARASYDSAKVAVISAETEFDLAVQALSLLTGQVPTSIKVMPEEFQTPKLEVENIQQWISSAFNQNPTILSAQKSAEYAEKLADAQIAERYPTVNAVFSWTQTDNYESFPSDRMDDSRRTSLGIEVRVPLYTGGSISNRILEAGLNHNNALETVENIKRSIELEVRRLVRTVENDKRTIEAQALAVESQKSALKATEVGYEVGTRNIVEVLDAQRRMFEAELGYRLALYNLIEDQIRLKRAAGSLTVDDLEAVNSLLQ